MSDDGLSEILRRDPRYPRAAYDFIRDALQFTVARAGAQRHVTARELLEGIRDHARDEFGPLARMVFESWNVHETADFGNLVFNLVEAGEMGKTEDDDIRDFDAVYRFAEAFPPDTGPVEVHRGGEDEDD
jgi:uncharacterized repeat protein (TIGR04138 family)